MIDTNLENILDTDIFLKYWDIISKNIEVEWNERFLQTFYGFIIIKKECVYKIFDDNFNFYRQLVTYSILKNNNILQPEIIEVISDAKIIVFENIREITTKISDMCELDNRAVNNFLKTIHSIPLTEEVKDLPCSKLSDSEGTLIIWWFHYSNVFIKNWEIWYLDLGSFIISDKERDLADIFIEWYYMDRNLFKWFLKDYEEDFSLDLLVQYWIKDLTQRKKLWENIHESKKIVFEQRIYYLKILWIIWL